MKNVFFYLLLFPLFTLAQKQIATKAENISPLLIGAEIPNAKIQKTDSTFVNCTRPHLKKENRFSGVSRRLVSVLQPTFA